MFDEDLRNPTTMPPPLMGHNFRAFEIEEDPMRREKIMQGGESRQRDLDLRHQFNNNDFSSGGNFSGDFQGGDARSNFHNRNNFNNRDMDFRNFEERNNRGGSFNQRNEMDFRGGREFEQRHRDFEDRYDDRENFDVGNNKDNNFDDRSTFNNSNNTFSANQRWDEGPSQENSNWGNRPPPLMSANVWENNDLDFRSFPNRSFQGGPNNNFGSRKSRGGRNQNSRSRPRRGRGRFPKN